MPWVTLWVTTGRDRGGVLLDVRGPLRAYPSARPALWLDLISQRSDTVASENSGCEAGHGDQRPMRLPSGSTMTEKVPSTVPIAFAFSSTAPPLASALAVALSRSFTQT